MNLIRKLLRDFLPKGSAIRQVSIIAGGTTLAQLLNFAIIPVISRIYSPGDFGVMAVFVSITAIMVEFSGFRFYRAIPLPKDERYAKALVVLSILMHTVLVSLIAMFVLIWGKFLLSRLSMEVLIPFRFLIPVAVTLIGINWILSRWAIREELFYTIAQTKITQSILGILIKVFLGIIGIRPFGLLVGKIVSQSGGILTLFIALIRKRGFPKSSKENIFRVAKRYRKFPLFETWSAVMNTLGNQMLPILFISLFDSTAAGFFAMSQNFLAIPSVFIGQAIGQVFLQRASNARYQNRLKELSLQTYKLMLQLGLFPIVMLSLFAPTIFPLLLGQEWQQAGYFAMVLGPWVAFSFIGSPMDLLFSVVDRQGTLLIVEIVQNLSRIGVVFVVFGGGGPLFVAGVYGFIGLIANLSKIFIILKVLGNSLSDILKETGSGVFSCFILLLIPFSTVLFNFETGIKFATSVIFLALYSFMTYRVLLKRRRD